MLSFGGNPPAADGGPDIGAGSWTEDVHLSLLSIATRGVRQSHVVGQSVHNASGWWIQGSREDEHLAASVAAEKHHLSVEFKCLGVIHIDILLHQCDWIEVERRHTGFVAGTLRHG